MQSSNYTQELKDAGLTTPAVTNYLVDMSLSNGGPIKKDRLWFFYATRYTANGNDVVGMFYNKNAGDPTKWTYEADLNRPARNSSSGVVTPTLRLTAQVTPREQVEPVLGRWWVQVQQSSFCRLLHVVARDGDGQPGNGSSRLQQVRWTSTLTNRLLLEAGLGTYQQNWNGRERPGNNRSLIRVVEQCAGGCPDNGGIAGLTYRAQNWNTDYMSPNRWFTTASYVTGAHSMKVGYQGVFHWNTSFPEHQ